MFEAEFGPLGSEATTPQLWAALKQYSETVGEPGSAPVSYIAAFEPESFSESEFELRLWQQLALLREVDEANGFEWDPSVSCDPESNQFSFSVGGRAYFVVGLHQGASRLARRAPVPCLVFNFHEPFELLKESGKYASMQRAIRARDMKLQGSINPVLARFGEASEARQYSGRAVESEWKCPFHHPKAE